MNKAFAHPHYIADQLERRSHIPLTQCVDVLSGCGWLDLTGPVEACRKSWGIAAVVLEGCAGARW